MLIMLISLFAYSTQFYELLVDNIVHFLWLFCFIKRISSNKVWMKENILKKKMNRRDWSSDQFQAASSYVVANYYSEHLLQIIILNIRCKLLFWTFVANYYSQHLLQIIILNNCCKLLSWTFVANYYSEHLLQIIILNICCKLLFWTFVANYYPEHLLQINILNTC